MDDTAKIRLKLGVIEIEYEGKASFLEQGLPQLLSSVSEFYSNHQDAIPTEAEPPSNGEAKAIEKSSGLNLQMSTNSIAAHLGVSTGPDLIMAAAAHLAFVAKKETFTRQELLNEMKTATTYFTSNMRSNLGSSLDGLQKAKRLNQPRTGVFALGAAERTSLESKLAGLA